VTTRGLIALDRSGRSGSRPFRLKTDGTHTAVVSVSTNGGRELREQPSLADLGNAIRRALISLGTRLSSSRGARLREPGRADGANRSDRSRTWSGATTALSDGIYTAPALSGGSGGAGGAAPRLQNLTRSSTTGHYGTAGREQRPLLEGTRMALQPAIHASARLVVFYQTLVTNTRAYASLQVFPRRARSA